MGFVSRMGVLRIIMSLRVEIGFVKHVTQDVNNALPTPLQPAQTVTTDTPTYNLELLV